MDLEKKNHERIYCWSKKNIVFVIVVIFTLTLTASRFFALNINIIATTSSLTTSLHDLFASISNVSFINVIEQPNKELRHADIYKWSERTQDWTLAADQSLSVEFQSSIESNKKNNCLWPEDCPSSDRIVEQLKINLNTNDRESIKIAIASKHMSTFINSDVQIDGDCAINNCLITTDLNKSDVIIFPNADVYEEPPKNQRSKQIWIAHLLESPPNTFDTRLKRQHRGNYEFNWTATYRIDSDIVTPYAKFVPFEENLDDYLALKEESVVSPKIKKNKNVKLAPGKQGKVAWLVSNCNARNDRLAYARELAKHIQVDIYGKCGSGLTCDKWNQTGCLRMINENYKFYLAFENSNHHDYITEKLYLNAFNYNRAADYSLLPIVMGAPRKDYERYAPPRSFLHVDDFETPQELANYLKILDSDETLYESFFHWKTTGTFIDTKFICRVCAMAHLANINKLVKSYPDIKSWWHNEF